MIRIERSEHHIEVLKQTDGSTTSSDHFLRFSTPAEGLEKQSVAIAFELDFLPDVTAFESTKPLHNQLKIVTAEPGRVAVFFPAEKETSGPRFHLHAPFVPELSRASIKETPANQPLYQQLAQLAASSLHIICNLDLLAPDFLSVLPNSQDTIPLRYQLILNAITHEMNNEALTPTHSKTHAPARHLFQARASLKDLLTEDDLAFLIGREDSPSKWAIAASQKNTNLDRFLSGLDISRWDVKAFVELLETKASDGRTQLPEAPWFVDGPDDRFMCWLANKPEDWHQQMYALLGDYAAGVSDYARRGVFEQLQSLRFVRLGDGTYSVGKKCFFPSDGVTHDQALPRVAEGVYSSGKSDKQQESARRLLEGIGVREVGEADQVEAILKHRYTYDAELPDEQTYFRDLSRFIALVDMKSAHSGLFEKYFIFERTCNDWSQANGVFLDSPYVDTGLSAYYAALGDEAERAALAPIYNDCPISIDRIAAFAKALGAQTDLEIAETSCDGNPQWDHLRHVPGQRYTSPIDRDYSIPGLRALLATPNIDLSRLTWRTMCSLPSRYLRATYRKNRSRGSRRAPSRLVHDLKQADWIPQTDGRFVCPSEALRELLPEGFPFDAGQEWLETIEFGVAAKKQTEEYTVRNHQAQVMGFASVDEAEQMAVIADYCRQQGRPLDDLMSQLGLRAAKDKPEFPSRTVGNSERRQEHLSEQLEVVSTKEYEPRARTVRVTRTTIEPGIWLRNQYTNNSGQMICQICGEEMPFRKRDGEYYFEAVEILSKDYLPVEHDAQFLALCPLCAARYKEFVKSDENVMLALKDTLIGADSPELLLNFGEYKSSLRFVETHFCDIKTILGTQT